jgi:hypothetical protein
VIIRYRSVEPSFFYTHVTTPLMSPRSEISAGNARNGSIVGWCWQNGSPTPTPGVVTKFKVYDWGATGTPPEDNASVTTDFLRSMFEGTAKALSAYVPEINTWQGLAGRDGLTASGMRSGDTAPLTHLALDGNGNMQYNTATAHSVAIEGVTPPGYADHYIEAVVQLGTTVSGFPSLDIGFGFRTYIYTSDPTLTGGYAAYFSIYDDDGPTQRSIQPSTNYSAEGGGMGSFSEPVYNDYIRLPVGATSVKLRAEIAGREAKLYVNDVLCIHEKWTGAAMDTPGRAELGLNVAPQGGIAIHKLQYVKAGSLSTVVIPPPETFWTDLVKAKELT